VAYTSFFRDADALKAIADLVIPELSQSREIRVWDAGCATGEEPYTLAILFASRMGPFAFRNLDILATDHEESSFPQFAERIRDARYSRNDVFWVPQALRELYFVPTEDPEAFRLTQEIRERVRFRKHDLLSCVAPETGQSLIVCKNVLMHFSEEQREGVLEMYYESLEPRGFLVLDGNQALPPSFRGRFGRVEEGLPLYRRAPR
jgi:chemotaxis protein methyltransferase CheR